MKKIIRVSVKEYVEAYNKEHSDSITRYEVYRMIKDGELKATKNPKGAWVIRLEIEEEVKYSVKQFVEKYNNRYKNDPITVRKVRELASKGKIKAKKVLGKWIILESPRKKIK